ncbi:hypothetical protein T484DRAFT_1978580 [Baffinella frigidus]|nr:hypothetical protein T484DRAFT_1978580 [Cryptophyta sp. CCMP2293]
MRQVPLCMLPPGEAPTRGSPVGGSPLSGEPLLSQREASTPHPRVHVRVQTQHTRSASI